MIDIKSDSRKVKPGDTFIAIKNVVRDGHDYIEDAIKNGATKIICEHGSYDVETEIVPDTRKYLEEYLYKNYYNKFKDIKVIGVTGTNGKTTTCYLVYQMLNKLGKKCAYIGTIGFYLDGEYKELNNTTPDVDLLYEMFLEAKAKKCEYVVMEASSHSLDKNRVYGLKFDEVAFTNLTPEHLDYHKTMNNYAKAKKILFERTRGKKVAIINADDKYHKKFIIDGNKNILYGKKGTDLVINSVALSHQVTSISFNYKKKDYLVKTDMVGMFNVYNYLMALLLVVNAGFDIDKVLSLSEKITPPPGRMDKISYDTKSIFIDYAHSPDAVKNVLKTALELKTSKIITVLGCGGDRDTTKRPVMGDIATKLSDYVIFTNDNPRTEDEKKIMKDIIKGPKSKNYEVIYDRKEAIFKAVSMLKDNDILMLLGKGHETYQVIGTEKIHFSDREEALNAIKKYG